jgi:hypothetical protein
MCLAKERGRSSHPQRTCSRTSVWRCRAIGVAAAGCGTPTFLTRRPQTRAICLPWQAPVAGPFVQRRELQRSTQPNAGQAVQHMSGGVTTRGCRSAEVVFSV